jgi:hypothetical protein
MFALLKIILAAGLFTLFSCRTSEAPTASDHSAFKLIDAALNVIFSETAYGLHHLTVGENYVSFCGDCPYFSYASMARDGYLTLPRDSYALIPVTREHVTSLDRFTKGDDFVVMDIDSMLTFLRSEHYNYSGHRFCTFQFSDIYRHEDDYMLYISHAVSLLAGHGHFFHFRYVTGDSLHLVDHHSVIY